MWALSLCRLRLLPASLHRAPWPGLWHAVWTVLGPRGGRLWEARGFGPGVQGEHCRWGPCRPDRGLPAISVPFASLSCTLLAAQGWAHGACLPGTLVLGPALASVGSGPDCRGRVTVRVPLGPRLLGGPGLLLERNPLHVVWGLGICLSGFGGASGVFGSSSSSMRAACVPRFPPHLTPDRPLQLSALASLSSVSVKSFPCRLIS